MHEILRTLIRKVFKVKEHENIKDALNRYKIKYTRFLHRKRVSVEALEKAIRDCGVSEGDVIMVHCAWRSMYNYLGTPEDVIESLKRIVGKTGTILMPCYGDRYDFLDVQNTPSCAGVLSEVFRKMQGVSRSECTHFSVAGWGARADEMLGEHSKSQYGFDRFSPCYKLGCCNSGKIVFLGLGAWPTKISVFHCAGFVMKDKDKKMDALLSHGYEAEIISKGITDRREMYTRIPGHVNDNKNFRRILKAISGRKHIKISNIDIVSVDSKEALETAVEFCRRGVYCYKKMEKL